MLYLFHGSDAFRIAEALKEELAKTKEAFGLPAAQPVMRLTDEDENPERVFSYLTAPSLFETHKIAVIERCDRLQKAFIAAFAEFASAHKLKTDKDIAVFISAVEEKPVKAKRRTASSVSAATSTAKPPLETLAAKIAVFPKLEEERFAQWIASRAEQRGLAVPIALAHRIAQASGGESAAAAQDIEKIALYLRADADSEKTIVTEEHLAHLTGTRHIEENAFRLIDAIGRKDRAGAMQILLGIEASGAEPVQTLGLLAYGLRAMLCIKDAVERPIRTTDLPHVTGLADWQIRQYRSAAANFELIELKKLYERLLGIDWRIKTGEGNPRMLLERFLLAL